jgi:hypothetical protein
MPTAAFAGNANVTHNAADPASPHQYTRTFPPDTIELRQEVFVILEVAHLIAIPRSILF